MKRLVMGLLALSFVFAVAIAPAPAAEEFQMNPFQLTNLAYEGHFRAEGIPGYLKLQQQYAAGDIKPRDVIKAAVQSGELPAETLQDGKYLNAVRLELRSLMDDNFSSEQ